MGQVISEFGVNRPFPNNPSPSEEEYREIQASLNHARNFQERMEIFLATPIPHKELMSNLLPRLSDPWPSGYRSLVETLAPIEDVLPCGLTPQYPGRTSNPAPAVSNYRSVSSPPIRSIARWKPSVPVVSGPSNVGGQHPT